MTKATGWWAGGLAAVALVATLALGGCADRMMGSGGGMKTDGDTMTTGTMDKGTMKDDKGMMDKT